MLSTVAGLMICATVAWGKCNFFGCDCVGGLGVGRQIGAAPISGSNAFVYRTVNARTNFMQIQAFNCNQVAVSNDSLP